MRHPFMRLIQYFPMCLRILTYRSFAQAYKKNVEELVQFIEAKMLPPETTSRLFKHVEFQVHLKS